MPGRRARRADHCGTHNAGAKQRQHKALFRSTAPALLRSSGDAPKAGHLRPTLAREALSLRSGEKRKHLAEATSQQQRLAQLRRL